MLARDVVDVERQLQAAQRSFELAREDLASGDVDGSSSHLQQVRRDLTTANSRVNRLVWRVAQRVPVAGRSLRTMSSILGVADESARLGRTIVEGARDLVGPTGRLQIQTFDGAIPLAPFLQAARALEEADTGVLRRELANLEAGSALLMPARVVAARERALAAGTEVADTVDAGRALLSALPALLGADGPRRYFLAMENPAELRGTGGLVGFFATVDVVDGRMTLSRPESYEAIDAATPENDEDELEDDQDELEDDQDGLEDRGVPFGGERTSVAVDPGFAARYATMGAARFFGNVNVHPDLRITGPLMAELYRIRTGQEVDGVIAINPIGLALLLQATGPVTLPADVAATAPGLPNPVPVERVPLVTMYEQYEAFQGRNSQRRDWLREFATAAFDSIFDARWDGVEMARHAGTAFGSGHLAVHVTDADVQAALETLDAAGALAPPDAHHDHVALIGNNAAGNKLDIHMGHRVTGTIGLSGDPDLRSLARSLDLHVELVHDFDPTGRATYVAGSFLPRAFETPPVQRGTLGLNRTWFSTWVPGVASVVLDGEPHVPTVFEGHTVVDRTLEATHGMTASFDVELTGPAPVTTEGNRRRYVLEWRRQPKANPDRLDLAIEPPAGWRISAISVRGGGNGGGTGPFGQPGPVVAASVDGDGAVRVSGDASSSVVIDVELVAAHRPLVDRLFRR